MQIHAILQQLVTLSGRLGRAYSGDFGWEPFEQQARHYGQTFLGLEAWLKQCGFDGAPWHPGVGFLDEETPAEGFDLSEPQPLQAPAPDEPPPATPQQAAARILETQQAFAILLQKLAKQPPG